MTTDDLSRLQEGSTRKRLRQNVAPLLDLDDSDEEAIRSAGAFGRNVDVDGEGSGTGSSSDEEEDEGRTSGEEDEIEEEPALPVHSIPDSDEDSQEDGANGSSRIAFRPRTTFQVAQQPLVAPPIKLSSFEALGISPALMTALNKMSIRLPTEIQAACIPPLLQGEFNVE